MDFGTAREALFANLPAHPGRFKLWISAIFCKNSSDGFLDSTGSTVPWISA
jgi:hypothetical protein